MKLTSRLALLGIAVVVVLGLTSCATIFTGTSDRVTFNSNPEGAVVYIDGLEICTTPCTVPVKRSLNDKAAEFKLDGYKTRVITLDREFNVVSVLNLAGLLGWAVDAATGAIFKYGRKNYDIQLEAERALSGAKTSRIELDTVNKTAAIYVAAK